MFALWCNQETTINYSITFLAINITIKPDKIGDVIGKGGAVIREITEKTNTTIDISDVGVVKIASPDKAAAEKAREIIESIVADIEVGQLYDGKVVKILDFGAIVSLSARRDGLLHISQISHERVENVHDVLKEGQEIKVKVLEIDRQGRIRLSKKAIESAEV